MLWANHDRDPQSQRGHTPTDGAHGNKPGRYAIGLDNAVIIAHKRRHIICDLSIERASLNAWSIQVATSIRVSISVFLSAIAIVSIAIVTGL